MALKDVSSAASVLADLADVLLGEEALSGEMAQSQIVSARLPSATPSTATRCQQSHVQRAGVAVQQGLEATLERAARRSPHAPRGA